jgi:hypothetical protein
MFTADRELSRRKRSLFGVRGGVFSARRSSLTRFSAESWVLLDAICADAQPRGPVGDPQSLSGDDDEPFAAPAPVRTSSPPPKTTSELSGPRDTETDEAPSAARTAASDKLRMLKARMAQKQPVPKAKSQPQPRARGGKVPTAKAKAGSKKSSSSKPSSSKPSSKPPSKSSSTLSALSSRLTQANIQAKRSAVSGGGMARRTPKRASVQPLRVEHLENREGPSSEPPRSTSPVRVPELNLDVKLTETRGLQLLRAYVAGRQARRVWQSRYVKDLRRKIVDLRVYLLESAEDKTDFGVQLHDQVAAELQQKQDDFLRVMFSDAASNAMRMSLVVSGVGSLSARRGSLRDDEPIHVNSSLQGPLTPNQEDRVVRVRSDSTPEKPEVAVETAEQGKGAKPKFPFLRRTSRNMPMANKAAHLGYDKVKPKVQDRLQRTPQKAPAAKRGGRSGAGAVAKAKRSPAAKRAPVGKKASAKPKVSKPKADAKLPSRLQQPGFKGGSPRSPRSPALSQAKKGSDPPPRGVSLTSSRFFADLAGQFESVFGFLPPTETADVVAKELPDSRYFLSAEQVAGSQIDILQPEFMLMLGADVTHEHVERMLSTPEEQDGVIFSRRASADV